MMTVKLLLILHLLLRLSPAGASESSIIGGKKAKAHSRPYMVSLQLEGKHICGGFLIRKDFVLTAAHCYNPRPFTAILGAVNIMKNEKKYQQKIPVKKSYKHQINAKSKLDFDIMLLKLQRNATLNKKVGVIKLAQPGDSVPVDTDCLMSGWGRKTPDGPAQDFLQDVKLRVQDSAECRKIWRKHFIPNRMMCTRFDGKKGICEGDSGGPLICKKKAHGIAAYTGTPCDKAVPNVYMNISYFTRWIKETMDT
ncbi:hypothetical protein AAFF_G00132690 [Aldrovandia affinis]|uniref:trypsin n=1 Tax=Aldrovandia affinis TaxID=143900 RepID=A0AAD7RQT8_9TELE|nr:hypothetical protein AAFF_G00132690 [Aldrovandia affinis]